MKLKRTAAAFALALACGLASAGGAGAAMTDAQILALPDPVPTILKSPDDVAKGKNLFVGVCGAYCHKMTPTTGDAPYLFGCTWIFGGDDATLFHTVTHGAPGTRMVSFKGAIPDADLWRIISFLKANNTCRK